jgi:hypothetical protein
MINFQESLDEAIKMEPLPPCVHTATELLGHGKYIVFPRTRKKLMRKITNFGYDRHKIGLILEAGAVIGGSFLLKHLMQGSMWKPNGIDIIGTRQALNLAKRILWKPDIPTMFAKEELYEVYDNICPISAPWIVDSNTDVESANNNQVIDYVCWTNHSGALLSFYCIAGIHLDDIYDCISRFDLPICRSFFDGKFIYVPNKTHKMLQTRHTKLSTNLIDMATLDDCGEVSLLHTIKDINSMLTYAEKYISRGFKIDLPDTILISVGLFDECNKIVELLTHTYYISKKELVRFNKDLELRNDEIEQNYEEYNLDMEDQATYMLYLKDMEKIQLKYPMYLKLKLIKK